MLLTAILLLPLVAALACLVVRRRGAMEWINVASFVGVLILAVRLFETVVTNGGTALCAWGEFLRADALSAWMVLLVAVVSLAQESSSVIIDARRSRGAPALP